MTGVERLVRRARPLPRGDRAPHPGAGDPRYRHRGLGWHGVPFRASSTWSATCSTCPTVPRTGRSGCTAHRSARPRSSRPPPGSCSFDRLATADRAALAERLADGPLTADEATVRQAFGDVDPSGGVGRRMLVRLRARRQRQARRAPRPTWRSVIEDWPTRSPTRLRPLVRTPDELAHGLVAAGAPARLTDLDSVTGPEHARWAVTNCAYMRNRLTVVDLLIALGWWTLRRRHRGPGGRRAGGRRERRRPMPRGDLVIGVDCSTTAAKAVVWNSAGIALVAGPVDLRAAHPRPELRRAEPRGLVDRHPGCHPAGHSDGRPRTHRRHLRSPTSGRRSPAWTGPANRCDRP